METTSLCQIPIENAHREWFIRQGCALSAAKLSLDLSVFSKRTPLSDEFEFRDLYSTLEEWNMSSTAAAQENKMIEEAKIKHLYSALRLLHSRPNLIYLKKLHEWFTSNTVSSKTPLSNLKHLRNACDFEEVRSTFQTNSPEEEINKNREKNYFRLLFYRRRLLIPEEKHCLKIQNENRFSANTINKEAEKARPLTRQAATRIFRENERLKYHRELRDINNNLEMWRQVKARSITRVQVSASATLLNKNNPRPATSGAIHNERFFSEADRKVTLDSDFLSKNLHSVQGLCLIEAPSFNDSKFKKKKRF